MVHPKTVQSERRSAPRALLRTMPGACRDSTSCHAIGVRHTQFSRWVPLMPTQGVSFAQASEARFANHALFRDFPAGGPVVAAVDALRRRLLLAGNGTVVSVVWTVPRAAVAGDEDIPGVLNVPKGLFGVCLRGRVRGRVGVSRTYRRSTRCLSSAVAQVWSDYSAGHSDLALPSRWAGYWHREWRALLALLGSVRVFLYKEAPWDLREARISTSHGCGQLDARRGLGTGAASPSVRRSTLIVRQLASGGADHGMGAGRAIGRRTP